MWNASLERELERATKDVRASMNRSGQHTGKLDVSRVSQLDALMLEKELCSVLKSQSEEVFKQLPESYAPLVAWAAPEINMLLRFVIWTYSHRVNQPAPGDALQNLRYRNERVFQGQAFKSGLVKLPGDLPTRWQRFLHGCGTVLVPWIWERTREKALINSWSYLDDQDWRKKLSEAMDKAEKAMAVASVVNLCLFFYNGKYRSLLDRALGMRLVYAGKEEHRSVSFEFINQQLLYDGFSQVLMCLLPLVNWDKLRKYTSSGFQRMSKFWAATMWPFLLRVYRTIKRQSRSFRKQIKRRLHRKDRVGQAGAPPESANVDASLFDSDNSQASSDSESASDMDVNSDLFWPDSPEASSAQAQVDGSCVVCEKETPCMPYRTSCGHAACYFCLKTLEMEKEQKDLQELLCPQCGENITDSARM